MKQLNVITVILCGISETRLWPYLRARLPKQFLVLSDKSSLFQQDIERLNGIASYSISVGETF